MPTDVSDFGGVFYATAYYFHGARLVVLGTLRADRAGVRRWVAAGGYARPGAHLTPAAGSPPGFYVKPYVSDVYYRVDAETGVAARDGTTRFGEPGPVSG